MKAEQILGVIALGILSWGSVQIYDMNAQLLLVSYRVDENHETVQSNYAMIKPLWQEFLARTKPVHAAK